jgi:hypothetical protein
MSAPKTSISFGSAYSVPDLINCDEIEDFIGMLGKAIQSFNVSKFNKIEFAKDLFDFKINGQAFQDRLLKAVNDDFGLFSGFLDQIDKSIGGNRSDHRYTQTMQDEIASQDYLTLPYKYSYSQGESGIPSPLNSIVTSYADACNHNSRHFKKGIADATSFTEKAILVYEHIDFHEDLPKTLATIKQGTLMDYLDVFSHALNTLNQAYHVISIDPAKNDDDLILIRTVSGRLGKTLDCSGEAKRKPKRSFPKKNILPSSPIEYEEINCEYHLKLNYDNNGRRLPNKYFNRAYFGLKWSESANRKEIKLAHLGAHL